MTQMTTTLNRIKAHKPNRNGWKTLLAGLGKSKADNKPLPFATILRISGLDFALWCVRAEPQHARVWRLFRVWCARRVQHLLTDPRSIKALDVAERYALGMATDAELRAARADAWDAARATRVAARAVRAARAAAGEAAWAAARAGARATGTAARAARAAAWEGAREAQAAEFLRIVGGE